jgi:hypothetical protein
VASEMTPEWTIVQPSQANILRGCANCGEPIGGRHGPSCYEVAKARQHCRDHLTDGRWHDECSYCLRRRVHGGTGIG